MEVMNTDGVVALILAGGEGNRLSVLTEERAKPAIPFGGMYRIIDFTLTNCAQSGVSRVGVLTQYNPQSLTEHIGLGVPWGLDRPPGGISILQPHPTRRRSGGWYKGTADAVYQNLSFVEEHHAQCVLILAGDHIYRMRYDGLVAFHEARKADVTVGVVEVPWDETHRFGVAVLDENNRIVTFQEKSPKPISQLASMGIYVFSPQVLKEVLEEDAQRSRSTHDFGRDLLPVLLSQYAVFAYRFSDYWRDVGTVLAYWQANMELLGDPPSFDLDDGGGQILTRHLDTPPGRIGPEATVQLSLLAPGCVIRRKVRHCVISSGVVVEEGSVVEDSVLLEDVAVKAGARVQFAILDKEAVVGEGTMLGHGEDYTPNQDEPENLSCGLVLVGKRAAIPGGISIGRNCKIMPGVTEGDFQGLTLVPSGATIQKRARRQAPNGVPVAP
jgi:glucose-1-phosphate adenylyltransferase